MNIRNCFYCGAGIRECMGFVLARDVLQKQEGGIARELCAKCGFVAIEFPERFLLALKSFDKPS